MPKRVTGYKWWEMFTLKFKNYYCKNQNKKNLLIKIICTISTINKLN